MGEFYSKKSCFVSFFLICIYLALSTSLILAQTTKPSRTKLPKQLSQPLAKSSQTQQIKTLNPNNLEKEAYRIWLDWHQAQKQGKNLVIPQFSVPTSLDKEEANRVLTIWEQAQTKAYWAVEEEEMYKVWLEYCRDQQQGITTEMPTLTHPSDVRLEQQNLAITHWQRAEFRAKRTVEKETKNRLKPTDQIEEQQSSNITESNSLPNVVIDDETRHKAARSISPLLDVPTSQPTSGFNQVVFNQPRGISGVSSYSGNSLQPSQLQPNSPEAVMINNNQLLTEMNAETMKAKKLVNIETAKHLVERHDNQKQQTNLNPVTSAGSQLVRRFVYGTQGPISMSQLINGQWVTSYFIYDGEGNIRALTDPNGNVTDTFDYDAFGNLTNRTGSTPNNRFYQGEELDQDLKIYYLRSRYYKPETGRFWTQDSFEGFKQRPQSLNKYVYADNNPINRRDPSGKFSIGNELSFNNILKTGSIFNAFTRPVATQNFGANPFPLFKGGDLAAAENALAIAKATPIPFFQGQPTTCDSAFWAYGIPSLYATISKLKINENVFEGINSSYVDYTQRTIPYSQYFKNLNSVSAETALKVPGRGTVIFLSPVFFNFMSDERKAVTLIHESLHGFAPVPFFDYDFPDGSKAITLRIKNDCFPRFPFTD